MECRFCRGRLDLLLDFGPQPVSHRFLRAPGPEDLFSLALHQCLSCGLVQIGKPVAGADLKPVYDWIRNIEPSAHIADLARRLAALPGVHKGSGVLGVSHKDDVLIDRMRECGFEKQYRMDAVKDLGLSEGDEGMESIRSGLTPAVIERLKETGGAADLVVARHILKYAHEPMRFLESLARLTTPGGYVIIEISECRTAIEALDYSVVWEEHVFYFTASTLTAAVERAGLEVDAIWEFPNANETCLVVVTRRRPGDLPHHDPAAPSYLPEEIASARTFAGSFAARRERIRSRLDELESSNGKIVILGAGHRTVAFVNLFGLRDRLFCVVDDHPKKQGLFMPGSQLPVRSSEALQDASVGVCLLAVKPEEEDKVIERNRGFRERGGIFYSIFPRSTRFLVVEATGGCA